MDSKYFVPFGVVDELRKIGYSPQRDHCLNSFNERRQELEPRPIYTQVFDWFDKNGIYFTIKPVIKNGNLFYESQMFEFPEAINIPRYWPDDKHYLTRIEANLAAVKKGIEIFKYRMEDDKN